MVSIHFWMNDDTWTHEKALRAQCFVYNINILLDILAIDEKWKYIF